MTTPRSLTNRNYVTALLIGVVFAAAVAALGTMLAVTLGQHSAAVRWAAKAFCDLNLVADAGGRLRVSWCFSAGSTNLFPLSIQAITYVAFGMACMLLYMRRRIYQRESDVIQAGLLPQDERTLIQPADIANVREKLAPHKSALVTTLIERALQQYQTTLSTAEAAAIVSSTTEVFQEELDSNYAVIKYLAWAIPSLGFVGTVLGIGRALTGFGDGSGDLPMQFITSNLSTAFDTTFVALLLSLILMLVIGICQAREEAVITRAHDYCLANLVNRLFNPEHLTR